MSIVRVSHDKENPYVVLNKKALEDPNLSWGAKGLWAYLLSRKDDWHVSVSHLATIFNPQSNDKKRGNGEKAIRGFLKELVDNGYADITIIREKGRFMGSDYVVYEFCQKHEKIKPITQSEPRAVKRHAVKPRAVKRRLVNNEVIYSDSLEPEKIKKTETELNNESVSVSSSFDSVSEKKSLDSNFRHAYFRFTEEFKFKFREEIFMRWCDKYDFRSLLIKIREIYDSYDGNLDRIENHEAIIEKKLKDTRVFK